MGKKDGIRMVVRPMRENSQLLPVLAGLPVELVMLLGIAMTWNNWFPSTPGSWWYLFAGMLGFSLLLGIGQLTGKGRWISGGGIFLLMGICGVFHRQFLSGAGCLGNDLLHRLTEMTGRIYLDFSIAQAENILWAVVPVLGICVLLMHLTVQTGKILFVLPVLLAHYGAVLTGWLSVDTGMILLGGGTILLLIYASGARTDCRGFRGAPIWLGMILLCAVVAGGIGLNVQTGESHWRRWIHTALYDQNSNSMPEGNLANLGAWEKSDTPALKLTMTQPQKMYLRGKIYEIYTGSSWTALDTQEQAEYESLFFWLHQTHFYGQSQIGLATSLTTQVEAEQMTIENLSACREQGYYPYALADSQSLDAGLIGDAYFPKKNTVSYYSGSVPQWYAVQRTLASAQERENVAAYLTWEEAYEQYVTDTDLQLTYECWSVLNRHLEQTETPKSLSEIRTLIREFLEENLVYDETVQTRNGEQDFTWYTLERSGSGYSVHYATLATLMLRYYGVPARYVEGYFLSEEEAAQYQAGQPIVLTEAHAHAWTEYYLPGVGFVPFEVTPGYLDGEEQELTEQISQNQQLDIGERLEYAQVRQPEHLEDPQQPMDRFSVSPVWLLILIPIFLAVIMIVILVRRKRFQKAMRSMQAASNRNAITMEYGYAVRLRQTCGNPDVEGSSRAAELNREALFSLHEMTDAQRQEILSYVEQVLQICKKNWTVRKKLYYRFWDCLF